MPAPLLAIEDYRCERDDRLLFQGLHFDLDAGQLVQIAGPNGTGKTTLLRSLAGLSAYAHGQLRWRGADIAHCRQDFRSDTLYMGHAPAVKLTLTPRENLQWFCSLNASQGNAAIDDALQRVGLFGYENLCCHQLSAGQQRRVALARMHLSTTRLWILDEPFTAIDKKGVAELEALLLQHANAGGAVIMTTHHRIDHEQLRIVDLEAFQ